MYEQESGLFDFRRTETSPLLLVIDRREDPVTPLLNQWTYQVHFLPLSIPSLWRLLLLTYLPPKTDKWVYRLWYMSWLAFMITELLYIPLLNLVKTYRLDVVVVFNMLLRRYMWSLIFWLIIYLQEVVLSSEQDDFYRANMFENFGDLGINIKRLTDEFQLISKSNQNIQTIG